MTSRLVSLHWALGALVLGMMVYAKVQDVGKIVAVA